MKDVAERAGVSPMTVSAAIAGSASVRVSKSTRARVLSLAQEMGYTPNAVARSLRRRQTNIIGLYSGLGFVNVRSPFFAEIVGGLQEGCERHQKDLILHGAFREQSSEVVYRSLADGRIDGLIVNMLANDPLVDQLIGSHLPVIAVVDAIEGIPSVVVDDRGGSAALAGHLAARGHRHILYASTQRPLVSVKRRRDAFLESASEYDLNVTESSDAGVSFCGADLLAEWRRFPQANRPSAVVCWNDLTAFDLLAQCHVHGVRVPDELAVAGFDGIAYPLMSVRRLTTIRAPWVDVARKAADRMIAMLGGDQIPAETVLPVELVPGDTV